ncbi:MAG: polysaccharide biosynthesis/export family protein [Pseudochelatococcus sp.]|jgi:polysaccharide export outer membrane protein|uniref:polysaccharide biosynthesis/export family protein n=1 Tax=Pseudochelatococcus sp. TaxID=2020869 RepID=UPI003D900C7D
MNGLHLHFCRCLVLTLGLVPLVACTAMGDVDPGAEVAGSAEAPQVVSSPAAVSSGAVSPAAQAPAEAAPAGDLRLVPDLPAPAATYGGTEQPIAPSDVLDVFVFQVPDLTRSVQVDSSGRITLPLIGTVSVAGKSVGEVGNMLTRAYAADYLQNPQVSVMIKSSASMRVTVDGEVVRAGVYPLPPTATLVDAIALAGGLSRIADTSKLFVFRNISGQTLVANYDVGQIRQGAAQNPRIYGGDVVVAFSSASKVAMQNLREALGMAVPVARLAIP